MLPKHEEHGTYLQFLYNENTSLEPIVASPSNIILQYIERGKSSINVLSIMIGNFWPIKLLPVCADQPITLPFFSRLG